MPLTAQDVATELERIAPKASGNAGDELGFIHGNPGAAVRGIAVMWNGHSRSIQRAADLGCNLLMVHETLYYEPQAPHWYQGPQSRDQITVNRQRRDLLERHGLVVYRAHSNWDALAVHGVPDQAVAALGVAGLQVIGQQKYFKVHRMPQPWSVDDLAMRAGRSLDLPWKPRVFGDPGRRVETFAWLIGGFGGNQLNMPQAAAELGAQCLIIGEMIEWFTIHALELGLSVIETLHSRSEIPALREQARLLAAAFPQTPVHYVDSGALGW
jgi:putative NIF3 family GTP cyclohydrolase 1 type 2